MSEALDHRRFVPTPQTMGTPAEPGPAFWAGWRYHGSDVPVWPDHSVPVYLEGNRVVLACALGSIGLVHASDDDGKSLYIGVAFGEPLQPVTTEMGRYMLLRTPDTVDPAGDWPARHLYLVPDIA